MFDYKPGEPNLEFFAVIVNQRRRIEIALSKRQQLILRYLVAHAGRRVRETELIQIACGLFDPEPAMLLMREEISTIEMLLSTIVGARAIHVWHDRTYQLEDREFGFALPASH